MKNVCKMLQINQLFLFLADQKSACKWAIYAVLKRHTGAVA
jgi:hypothetical protein